MNTAPSRRTLLRWMSAVAPAFGASAVYGPLSPAQASPDLNRPEQRAAILALGAWMARNGLTPAALEQSDGNADAGSGDIRESFEKDALVSVDGFMLPTGFCRYCLAAAYQGKLVS